LIVWRCASAIVVHSGPGDRQSLVKFGDRLLDAVVFELFGPEAGQQVNLARQGSESSGCGAKVSLGLQCACGGLYSPEACSPSIHNIVWYLVVRDFKLQMPNRWACAAEYREQGPSY
jgi:hypothetical protein